MGVRVDELVRTGLLSPEGHAGQQRRGEKHQSEYGFHVHLTFLPQKVTLGSLPIPA